MRPLRPCAGRWWRTGPSSRGSYHSVQREQIESYLYRVIYGLLIDVVEELSGPYHISREDQEYITNFYKYAFVGVMLDWVKSGMREPPEQVVAGSAR